MHLFRTPLERIHFNVYTVKNDVDEILSEIIKQPDITLNEIRFYCDVQKYIKTCMFLL